MRTIRRAALLVVTMATILAGLVGASSPASAAGTGHLYWGALSSSPIGRFDLDGTNGLPSFIPVTDNVADIAVTADFIYWVNYAAAPAGAIRRANVDGSNVTTLVSNLDYPGGLSVAGGLLYWTEYYNRTISRATLSGTQATVLATVGSAGEVIMDVEVTDAYIYWVNITVDKIGRAALNGTNAVNGFITPASSELNSLTVSATHIYWTNGRTGFRAVGRANLDGSGVNGALVSLSNAVNPYGVAVDDEYLYWAQGGTNTIARSRLDGTSVNASFASTGSATPWALAVRVDASSSGFDPNAPADIVQQVEAGAGSCATLASPADTNWAGVGAGGWAGSWAQWASQGRGGSVCTRTLGYSGGRWIVR